MERIAALYKQLPKRKKPARQESSKVLQETEPDKDEDPFGHTVSVSGGGAPMQSLRSPTTASSSSSTPSALTLQPSVSPPSSSSKSKKDKSRKKSASKFFNLEKERPAILQAIASSSVASTNLMNALKLINREHKRVSEDPETVNRFETCKQLRRQILRYIQYVESEQWLGSLIHANEGLVEALMAFEVLDKSVDDDSDSDDNEWDSDEDPVRARSPGPASLPKSFAGLSFSKPADKAPPPRPPIGGHPDSDDESDEVSEEEADDDPFADRNALHA